MISVRRVIRLLRTVVASESRVRAHWDEEAGSWFVGRGVQWTEVPAVAARINERVSGRAAVDPYQYFAEKYLQGRLPLDRCITLGCGAGEFERGVAKYGAVRHHEAVDIAPGAIERARTEAASAGYDHIQYRVADLNTIALERDTYDAAFGLYSIHHVERLEHLFAEVVAALRPAGFFVLNEYVGPTRFQWTERQLVAINGLLDALPPRLKRFVNEPGREKQRVKRPTPAAVAALDPSESIRSADILLLLGDFFDIVEVKPYGGTILQSLLLDIAGNFDTEDPGVLKVLEAVMDLEEALIDMGDLSSDFAFIVARKP